MKCCSKPAPLISVVIPVYNRAELVKEAVDSVLEQTRPHLELIVVDDGSVDATPEVLKQFADHRLRIITRDNGGVSAARNTGIGQSSGDMIALLDSDDYWLPKKLEIQVAAMLQNGWEISQTEEIWYRRGKRVNQMKKHAKPEGFFFEKAVEMCLVSPSCVMFTRSFWNELGPFDESLPACEDYDLWLRTLLHHPVGLVREALTVKRGGRPDQLSNCTPHLDLYRIYALLKLLETEQPADKERDAVLRELEKKSRIYVSGCEKHGRSDEAERVANMVSEAVKRSEKQVVEEKV